MKSSIKQEIWLKLTTKLWEHAQKGTDFRLIAFRVDELNSKEFKNNIEKAKTCRQLMEVLKVGLNLDKYNHSPPQNRL